MADNTLRPLQTLAQQNPVQNNRIAQGLQAARSTGLQQAVAAAPAGTSNVKAAQTGGAQQAAAAGQINTQVAQQTVQDQQKLGQMGLAAQGAAASEALGKKQLNSKKRQQVLIEKLGQVDKKMKNRLIDETISFNKDEMGRTLFNTRQLLDYKLASAKSDIDMQKYEQQVRELSQKKMQMLQVAHKKVMQELEQSQQSGQQQTSQQQTKRLIQAKINLEEKMRKEAAEKKNRGMMANAAGALVGIVIGSYTGNSAAGNQIGGGVGSSLNASDNNQSTTSNRNT